MDTYVYYIIICCGLFTFICSPILLVCNNFCCKKNNNDMYNNIQSESKPLITKV
jgi:hypothetical protein